ncbi:hypothetical protein [Tenacibaculum xiamenense]|uniref:hypothetical protein n=1 Tax=Tenacibaculum xiamenense TaxID=1261553 RepID=UPI0038945C14
MLYLIDGRLSPITIYHFSETYIEKNVSPLEANYKSEILRYFNKSYRGAIVLMKEKCVVCNESIREYGNTSTDGFWSWNTNLTHYVEKHNLKLPEVFEQYLYKQEFRIKDFLLDDLEKFYLKINRYVLSADFFEDNFESYLRNRNMSLDDFHHKYSIEECVKIEKEFDDFFGIESFDGFDLKKVNYVRLE